VTENLKAVALAAPEPRERMAAEDWRRVERHAAPQAIEARLKRARRALSAAQRTVDRWEALLALRLSQVAAGTWPPPVERVAWRELRAGDVLADPDRDVLVEVAETVAQNGRDVTTIWYQAPHHDGLYSRSAPADLEIVIRPRAEGGGEEGRRRLRRRQPASRTAATAGPGNSRTPPRGPTSSPAAAGRAPSGFTTRRTRLPARS